MNSKAKRPEALTAGMETAVWPQERECLVCGERRLAQWAGDRLHNRCRRDLDRVDRTPEHRVAYSG